MRFIALAALLFATPSWAQEFRGYPCTQDCSGHRAGYEWAQRKGLTSADQCGGKSNSFIEGCRSAFEDQDDGDDDSDSWNSSDDDDNDDQPSDYE
jgi:hypothetical protein